MKYDISPKRPDEMSFFEREAYYYALMQEALRSMVFGHTVADKGVRLAPRSETSQPPILSA